jgi:hypothetical protein
MHTQEQQQHCPTPALLCTRLVKDKRYVVAASTLFLLHVTLQAPRRLVATQGSSKRSGSVQDQPQRGRGQNTANPPKKAKTGGEIWRALMEPTRKAASRLISEGLLQATQKGQVRPCRDDGNLLRGHTLRYIKINSGLFIYQRKKNVTQAVNIHCPN